MVNVRDPSLVVKGFPHAPPAAGTQADTRQQPSSNPARGSTTGKRPWQRGWRAFKTCPRRASLKVVHAARVEPAHSLPPTPHRRKATRFVLALLQTANQQGGGVAVGSYDVISKGIAAMGCHHHSRRTVCRVVDDLRKVGWVKSYQSGYSPRAGQYWQGVNRYVVTPAGEAALESGATDSTKEGGSTTSTSSTTSSPTTSGTAQRAATPEWDVIAARRLASRPPLTGPATTKQVLESALWWATQGWQVEPMYLGAKKLPLTRHGSKDASTNPEQIRRWWKEWPGASLAVVVPEGYWVLDVDPRHGGDLALADLEAHNGRLQATVEAISGGGGRHLFFTNPGLGKLASQLRGVQGLDVLGPGRLVVVAPSTHPSGKQYAWKPGCAPGEVPYARAPEWLERLAVKPTPPKVARIYAPFTATRAAVLGPIHEGRRNDTLHKIGSGLRGYRGLEEYEIAERLQWHNQTRCDSPLPLCEVQEIARSCARYRPVPRR